MRFLIQSASVLAIAVGVGMLVAGSTAAPYLLVNAENERQMQLVLSSRPGEFYHGLAIGLKGFGSGFLTLGILGLVLPWIEVIINALRSPPQNLDGSPREQSPSSAGHG
ncbi:MAG: hypothetical protein SFV23_04265 [Planctomycetaceae bacterium]|nr:hypothetical protein [Planctomycetaceae bacterium]